MLERREWACYRREKQNRIVPSELNQNKSNYKKKINNLVEYVTKLVQFELEALMKYTWWET